MRAWLGRQWEDVKGNAKWALAIILWGFVVEFGQYVLHHAAKLTTWQVWTVLGVVSLLAFVWLTKQTFHIASQQQAITKAQSAATLTTTAATLDPKQFFLTAYSSPLTDEAENNIRAVAMTHYPNTVDRENFYARFIGVGIQSFVYEQIWWLLFKSQLLLLRELNQKVLTLDEAKRFYTAAENEFPTEYAKANENFDLWLQWLRDQMLISQDGMKVAITPRGRDFLKYIVHTGKPEGMKRL